MPFFGDIAKTAKDLISGGFAYDNKYTCDVKNVSGTPLRLSGAVVQKNGERDPTGTVKVTVDHPKGLVLESEAAVPSGKISGTLSYAGAIPGFKASLSGQVKDTSTTKIAMQWLRGGVGVKCDLTELVSDGAAKRPKADVSASYAFGGATMSAPAAMLGATAAVDAKKGAVGKYSLAAQVKAEDHTLALVLADNMDTVKGSWVAAVGRNTVAGVEGTYRVKKGAAAAAAAVSTKWHPACSGKVVLASPLPLNGASFAPVVSLQTSGDVAAETVGSFSLQVEALTRKYKYGVQFATKI